MSLNGRFLGTYKVSSVRYGIQIRGMYTRLVSLSKAAMPSTTSQLPPVIYCGVEAFKGEK